MCSGELHVFALQFGHSVTGHTVNADKLELTAPPVAFFAELGVACDAAAQVGKDLLSPAAPLPYVGRYGVTRIGCAAVARV